jgi:2'-5' RNA ligase
MREPDAATERLFLAVPLAEDARNEIIARLPPLPGRIVPPGNWHFTLRYLGNTAPTVRDSLVSALRNAALGRRFSIRFDGLGAFPRPRRARIIWLGVTEGAAQLAALAESVESVVRRTGFPAEERPFRAHLTLSRIEPARSIADTLAVQPQLDVTMTVRDVCLIRSELGAGPARYALVERVFLKA